MHHSAESEELNMKFKKIEDYTLEDISEIFKE